MARRNIPMPCAAAIRELADAQGRLAIRATPNASADAVLLPSGPGASELIIRTTATPEDGKANMAILRLLAEALGQPASALELLHGGSARTKLVRIQPAQGTASC
jgi:uncharacterized protein YggU (UPF0235/DUF167 family)